MMHSAASHSLRRCSEHSRARPRQSATRSGLASQRPSIHSTRFTGESSLSRGWSDLLIISFSAKERQGRKGLGMGKRSCRYPSARSALWESLRIHKGRSLECGNNVEQYPARAFRRRRCTPCPFKEDSWPDLHPAFYRRKARVDLRRFGLIHEVERIDVLFGFGFPLKILHHPQHNRQGDERQRHDAERIPVLQKAKFSKVLNRERLLV